MAESVLHTDLRVEISNRQILKIALPITLAMLIPQANFVINNIFLGHIDKDPQVAQTALATAGITGVFYLIFALVGNGLNSGLQSLLARRAGENRPEEIGKLFTQGIWIAMFFAVAAILLTYILAPYALSLSLRDPDVYDKAISFLKIRVWGVPFLYLFQMYNALLVGTNNSRYMKYGFWIQAILNIGLDWALIFGHMGLPKLGFNGAAWASVISEIAGMFVVIGIVLYKKFNLRFSLFKNGKFNKPVAGLIFRQSSPLVLQWLLSILAWMLFYIFIENMGEQGRPLAISNTMRNIFGLFGIFVWAFASTANMMVSNIIGQGKKEQVVFLIKKIALLSISFTAVLCLLINLLPYVFLGMYTTDRSFVVDSIPVIRIVTFGMLIMSLGTVWLNAVTGTGNTKINLAIEVVAIVLYSVYIYLVLKVFHLGLIWAWASEILYWGTLFILSYLYIRSEKWKKKEI